MKKQRLVVGISGSSGAILGIRLLEALRSTGIETHLVITPSARLTIEQETTWTVDSVQRLAHTAYNPRDLAAPIASGSFDALGMVVIPCSIKSLSAIANSYSGDLLTRAADVTMKEGRPLLLVVREAPLHAGHIDLMAQAARSGAVIFPPVPAFYTHPQTVDEIVDNIAGRVLRRLGIENDLYVQWQGLSGAQAKEIPVSPEKSPAAADSNDFASSMEAVSSEEAENSVETVVTIDDLWALPAMTLSTSGPGGAPHAAAVYFAADERRHNLYFFSAYDSQHSLDLATNPRAAASIHPLVDDWQKIQGLQLRGEVHPVAQGEEWLRGWERYLAKFPFAGGLKEILIRNTLYTFRPDWVRWIDNRRGFGHKEEWTPQ